MRLFIACRLFSGIEQSIIQKKWAPTGSPAIFKLIEELDRSNHDIRLLFTAKDNDRDNHSDWNSRSDVDVRLEGLELIPTVLAGKATIPSFFGRAQNFLRELHQTWRIWKEIRRFQPDLVYLDNANILAAALLSRLTTHLIVFRLLGIYPVMRECHKGQGWRGRYLRFCYGSPFFFSLCVIDGSGGRAFMERTLCPKVPKLMVMNGTDLKESPKNVDPFLKFLPKNKTIVLFVGKIERFKGGITFVNALIALNDEYPGDFHGVIVGTGTKLEEIKQLISEHEMEDKITLIDRLAHDQIFAAHDYSDIYVSLNHYGNLSNANLEAIAKGQCMIIPGSQPETGVDTDTDAVIPGSAVLRLKEVENHLQLAGLIRQLHEVPEERARLQSETTGLSRTLLWGWGQRINWEIDLLERLAKNEDIRIMKKPVDQAFWVECETEKER